MSEKSERDDNVDKELDAKFDKLETGEFPTLNDGAEPMQGTSNEKELQANVAELMTRLSLTEESYAVAIKERDAADEARRKLERTLAEFLTRFASVRETQSAAFKEVEKLGDVRRDHEKKLAAMASELTATQEARAAALRSRDEALAKLEEQKNEVEQARIQLSRFQEMAVASLEPLSQEQSRKMKALVEETDGVIDEASRVRDEMEQVMALAADLKAHITATVRDMGQQLASVLGSSPAISGTRDAVASGNAQVSGGGTSGGTAAKTQSMAAVAGE